MNLAQLQTGDKAVIVRVGGSGAFRKRILEMGFVQGKEIMSVHNAPLKDPIYYKILDYNVSLRRKDAELIEVRPLEPLTEGYHGSSPPLYDSTPSRGETEGEYPPS